MSDNTREDFNVNANIELHQALLAARKAGKRHGKKLISCTLAFELGARILLDITEGEEEALIQRAEELQAKKAALIYEEKLNDDQLRMIQASKTAKMLEAADQNDTVQKLAQRIMDVWVNVTFDKKRYILNSLVNVDTKRLTRGKLDAVFPQNYTNMISIDEAVKMAIGLLEGDEVGA